MIYDLQKNEILKADSVKIMIKFCIALKAIYKKLLNISEEFLFKS